MSDEQKLEDIAMDYAVNDMKECADAVTRHIEKHQEVLAANVELLEVLEAILDTGLPRNRGEAEKLIARARGETDGE
mgnify:CR=1 FL=1